MAIGKGDDALKLEKNIACIKYTLFCFNIIAWILGISLFGLSIWIVSEPNYAEWLAMLDAGAYYIGLYILLLGSIIMMIVSFLGCGAALMEHHLGLMVFIGTQVAGFVVNTIGAAVLLDFSTLNSSLQPILKRSLTWLISRSAYPEQANVLRLIQESLGCCGADGSNDYMTLRQPLPSSCRDSVTGNAFFNGCSEELTWFLEDKSVWVAGLAVGISSVCVANAVLSGVLGQALKKEEEEARDYRR